MRTAGSEDDESIAGAADADAADEDAFVLNAAPVGEVAAETSALAPRDPAEAEEGSSPSARSLSLDARVNINTSPPGPVSLLERSTEGTRDLFNLSRLLLLYGEEAAVAAVEGSMMIL